MLIRALGLRARMLWPCRSEQCCSERCRCGRADAARITAAWTDWVAFAQRVLQADALWRDVEARGDAWDEGFSAARDVDARNPYR